MALEQRNRDFPDCLWVFSYQGRRIGGHVKGWKVACEAAGLPGLHSHDLRRSGVRVMERAGIPRHVAMEISGHRTEAVYRRYDIVSPQDLKDAGRRMEDYLRTKWAEAEQEKQPDAHPLTQSGKFAHYTHTKPSGGVQ